MESLTDRLANIIEGNEIGALTKLGAKGKEKTFYSLHLLGGKRVLVDYFFSSIDAIEHFLQREIKKVPMVHRPKVRKRVSEERYLKPTKERPVTIQFDFIDPKDSKVLGFEIGVADPSEFVQEVILNLQRRYEMRHEVSA